MAKGHASRTYSAQEKDELKAEILEMRSQALSWNTIAQRLNIGYRTMTEWRQKDETFALACAAADGQRRDFLVDKCLEMALSDETPAAQKAWMLMFLTKQADPSFRENHKVEHTVTPGLAATLRQFAKLGRSEA